MRITLVALLNILIIIADGIVSTRLKSKIIGGRRVPLGSLRFIVSFRQICGTHFCGGNLITDTHVLTAAHCVIRAVNETKPKYDGIYVVVGSLSRIQGGISHEIKYIDIHPDFGRELWYANDIAVVTIKKKVTLGENVSTINLPRGAVAEVALGTEGIVAGWGGIYPRKFPEMVIMSSSLKMLRTRIVDSKRCEDIYGISLLNNEICVESHDGKGSIANGDSGSPFIHITGIIGIISSIADDEDICPAILTNVSHYLTYIEQAKKFSELSINDQ